jgi:hypothetical protein
MNHNIILTIVSALFIAFNAYSYAETQNTLNGVLFFAWLLIGAANVNEARKKQLNT